MRIIVLMLSIIILSNLQEAHANRRPMWVWDTDNIIGIVTEENKLIDECLNSGITDLYMYIAGSALTAPATVKVFISKASCNNIRVWGMDGWRGYFSDLCGPAEYYNNIQAVINYNSLSLPEEKFVGFNGDNEFQVYESSSGCGTADVFHWGYSDGQLSTTGSGIWKSTQKQDRDSLMADFVKQTKTASALCHNAGIEYSVSIMPWITGVNWTNGAVNNQNTPLYATYNGVTKALFKHLMDYVDEYVIMSYHTNVQSKVTLMCEDPLAYADGLAVGSRPRILSALETHCGVAQYVSYCDTPGENSKTHVLNDEIPAHTSLLGVHASFSGTAIHDWIGWEGLAPASVNTAAPPNSACSLTSLNYPYNNDLNVVVFPNPAEADLNISVRQGKGEIAIRVYNCQGIEVLKNAQIKENSNGGFIIKVEDLPQGFYLVQISDGNTESIVKLTKK
ncbi:MAG TPA: T9SS type A sorting domain-containing protein [Cytophagaceae bacterium]|nr:T9SS type A sorting domain-containing protein [Cytophagaceae bacterium]